MDGRETAYHYSDDDAETKQHLLEIGEGRGQAKMYLARTSSDPGIKKANIEKAKTFFKNTSDFSKEKFGTIVFSESKLFNGLNDSITTTKTLLAHIIKGPHVTRTTKEHYSGGGRFDLWNSGSYKVDPMVKTAFA